MTTFMHDVARAALPVAIGLLTCTAAAAAVLWSRFDDAQAQRLARQYLEPLSTWCLVALATHTLALGAAGEASVLSLVLPLALGAGAVLLRSVPGSAARSAPAEPAKRHAAARSAPAEPAKRHAARSAAAEPVKRHAAGRSVPAEPVKHRAAAPPPPAPRPPADAPPATTPAAHPAAPLWADPADDESTTRSGLWSRA